MKLVGLERDLEKPREQVFNTHSVMAPNQHLLSHKTPLANTDKNTV